MAKIVDPPGGNTGDPTPGPGYTPPTGASSKISFVVSGSSCTVTADMIAAAGGPWPAFTLKVTPVNDAGSGTAAEASYPPS